MNIPPVAYRELRRALPSESQALTALAVDSKRHWGYPDEWIEEWRHELIVPRRYIEDNDVFVATEPDDPHAGFYGLAKHGRMWRLDYLYVGRRHIGRGVGRRLLDHAASRAKGHGCRKLHIDADPFAGNFYLRMGAQHAGNIDAPMEPAIAADGTKWQGAGRERPQFVLAI